MSGPGTDDGLSLLLDRGWGQERLHQLILRELLAQTQLATVLCLWSDPEPPVVMYEPFGGLFDLALAEGAPRILLEIKVGADLGYHQRDRQRAKGLELGVGRAYVLLGPSFFAGQDEADARNIGVPELAQAIEESLPPLETALGQLGSAYLRRLEVDVRSWTAEHDVRSTSGLDLFRLYAEMTAAWPVDVRPTKVTHHGGPDWIVNADAWTKGALPGWECANFYWEMVNGRTRFKLHWEGDERLRLIARNGFREALEQAASELAVPVARTKTKAGAYMTSLELAGDARDEVVVEGRVNPERSLALYRRATAVFERALEILPALEPA
jgi:hypothetical protein